MKKSKIMNCPTCKSSHKTQPIGVYSVCARCHMMYVDYIPQNKGLKSHIENEAELIIDDGGNGEILKVHKDRLKTLKAYMKPKSSLLDVGCGKGQFINLAKRKGYDVVAMDKSKTISKFIKRNFNIPTYTELKSIRRKFDTITSFDVIEHTVQPSLFVQEINGKLLKGGILMITTPNARGISGRILRNKWWVFGPESHFNLFTIESLKILLKENGFIILRIKSDTLTQWLPTHDKLWKKIVNKVVYILLEPFTGIVYAQGLGDNIEIIARKI